MTHAMFAALSLFCVDGAIAARAPATEASIAPIVIAQADVAPSPTEEPVTAPPLTTPPEFEPAADQITNVEPDISQEDDDREAALVFADKSDAEVVDLVMEHLSSLDTLKGDFTQVAPSGAISDGEFYIDRPRLLRFDYEPPSPLLIVANGGLVYVYDDALETTDSYPLGKTPLKYLLRKKIELDDVDVSTVDRGVDSVALTLTPTDDETEGEITLIFAAPELMLSRWIVRDVQNGVTVVALDNVVAGERIARRLFEIPEAGGQFLKR